MSWHIGDYHKDTGHLRAAEHGAYFLLCMHYWATGGLPDDDRQLAAIARMTAKEWKQTRPILEPFFKGDGPWRHKRIDKELSEAQAKYERRALAGSKGGKAKAETQQSSSNATASPKQPITLTDNPKEQASSPSSSAARARRQVVEAFEKANSPNIPDTSRVDLWIAQGWQPEIFIPVVEEGTKKNPSISTLAYFDKAIAEAHQKRNPSPAKLESQIEKEARWRIFLDRLAADRPWPFRYPSEIPAEFAENHMRQKAQTEAA